MNFFSLRFFVLFVSIAMLLSGVWLMLNPSKTMLILSYIAAFIILTMSASSLVYFLRVSRSFWVLFEMIVSFALALILLFCSDEIGEDFVPMLLALWLAFRGVLWILSSIKFGFLGNFGFGIGVFCLILGVIFMIFPNILAAIVSFGLGLIVLAGGLFGFFLLKNLKAYQGL